MSSTTRQHFTPDDLNMLRRVLENAGFQDRPGEASHLARLSASRFLIGCFQQGFSTEMELRFELFHHLYQDMSERTRADLAVIQTWENEGGAMASDTRPRRQPIVRLVSSQAMIVRRIMLGFPIFIASDDSPSAANAIPQILTMAA